MKNAIIYYYNMIINDIHQKKEGYFFTYQNSDYMLTIYQKDISVLKGIYDMHILLLNRGVKIHQIVLNKDNQIITLINDIPYILLKINNLKKEISILDIIEFTNLSIVNNQKKEDTSILWSNKNDHLEYQINKLGIKYPLITESFSYYIGLAENAISLLNLSSDDNTVKAVSHDRIKYKFDLYSPLNLIIDSRVRDISEYFKMKFFYDSLNPKEVINFLTYSNYNKDEYIIFLARLFYPTYYFDLYEKIIKGDIEEDNIKKIINKVDDYEIFLKIIYNYYKGFIQLYIDWLE